MTDTEIVKKIAFDAMYEVRQKCPSLTVHEYSTLCTEVEKALLNSLKVALSILNKK
jgi:hypothetical protein